MANSTVGGVDFRAKAELNLGGKSEHGGVFSKLRRASYLILNFRGHG